MELAVQGGFVESSRKLKPWQFRNLERCLNEQKVGCGVVCADDMGYGKTTTAIVVCAAMRAVTGKQTCVACVPNVTVNNLKEEVAKLTEWKTVVEWQKVKGRAEFSLDGIDLLIVTHAELFTIFRKHFVKAPRVPFQRAPDDFYARWLRKEGSSEHPIFSGCGVAAFVVDESHVFRNNATLRYAAAMFASRNSAFTLALSGTPQQNRVQDFVAQLHIVRARKEFITTRVRRSAAAKLIKDLHSTSLIRATESLDLPPLTQRVVELEMSPEEGSMLDKVLEESVGLLENETKVILFMTALMKTRKLTIHADMLNYGRTPKSPDPKDSDASSTSSESDDDDDDDDDSCDDSASSISVESSEEEWSPENVGAAEAFSERMTKKPNEKLRKCAEIAREFIESGSKVIIFSSFVAPLFALRGMVGQGRVLYGGMTDAQKDETIQNFKDPKGALILFASVQCAGLGLNLFEANKAIILDLWWNPFVVEQAVRRIWRLGQEKECEVVYVQYKNSFDDAVAELYHSWKRQNHSILMTANHEKESVEFGAKEAIGLLEHIARKRGREDIAFRAAEVARKMSSARTTAKEAAIASAVRVQKRKLEKVSKKKEAAGQLKKKPPTDVPVSAPLASMHIQPAPTQKLVMTGFGLALRPVPPPPAKAPHRLVA